MFKKSCGVWLVRWERNYCFSGVLGACRCGFQVRAIDGGNKKAARRQLFRKGLYVYAKVLRQRPKSAFEALADRLEFPLAVVAVDFAENHRGFHRRIFG